MAALAVLLFGFVAGKNAFRHLGFGLLLTSLSSGFVGEFIKTGNEILRHPRGKYDTLTALVLRGRAHKIFPEKGLIMDKHDGGYYSYGLGYPSFAVNYHRNINGICDAFNFYETVDAAEVIRIIKKYDIKYIVTQSSFFIEPYWDADLLKQYSPHFPYTDIRTPRCVFHTDAFRPGAPPPFLASVHAGKIRLFQINLPRSARL
jgi:hypothetical protein